MGIGAGARETGREAHEEACRQDRARVPEGQAPFFFLPGRHGGWFIALTWNVGASITVTWTELRRLLASSKGDVLIARRLVGDELRLFERSRGDIDHDVHARVISREDVRWRSPSRSPSSRYVPLMHEHEVLEMLASALESIDGDSVRRNRVRRLREHPLGLVLDELSVMERATNSVTSV